MQDTNLELDKIRAFYDSVYYKSAKTYTKTPGHHKRLAQTLGIAQGERVLDVACGLGEWLATCASLGAMPHGVDISEKAVDICKAVMPSGSFFAQPAESLPFPDGHFDVVSCLGSLEHFVDQEAALKEMARVARKGARILILVPNSDFLTRRLGLYGGTQQVAAKEELRTLEGWNALFESCGLRVERRWRDLHVLSWPWISSQGILKTPTRGAQALALAVWPLKWQYQVFHLCSARKPMAHR